MRSGAVTYNTINNISSANSAFSLPKIAAGLIGLSIIYSFASMFYYGLDLQSILKGYASMRGLLSLFMLGLSGFAAYELWKHQADGWWLGLAVSIMSILMMIYNIFTYARTGEISLVQVVLAEIPTMLTIIILLLPKTRELCEVDF